MKYLLDTNACVDLLRQYDMMIAAHALSLGVALITDNEREFRRVAGLNVENWSLGGT